MLKTLHISNYALIENIDIDLTAGLNIITGETGAGKSIMLGALGLIMGARADLRVVRDSARKTVAEAVFDGRQSQVGDLLAGADIDSDSDECILRREITARGGSRAFINDTPVNLNFMRQVAVRLIDIHSQHQNLLLADPSYQLSVIDTVARTENLLVNYSEAYKTYRHALRQYTSTRDMLKRSRDEQEYISYQLAQIDELKLSRGEQAELERRRDTLANVSDIKMRLREAIDAIAGDNNVVSDLRRSRDGISRLDEIYSEAPSLAARLDSAAIEVADILDTLGDYDASLSADPAELAEAEDRLSEIYSLETRHHVDDSDALMDLADKLRQQLDTIAGGDLRLAELEQNARRAKKDAVMIAREISQRRRRAAQTFIDELMARTAGLGLDNLRFEIAFTDTKLTPVGIDGVEFLFAFNKNQELMSVDRTASGGEISRVILAVKAVIAERMSLPTIVFDEVDTGVSGDIAVRMGREMAAIACHTQVITITHLPQVASLGVRHFKVYKLDDETSTKTHIALLDYDERIAELALMISGDSKSPGARATATDMLGRAHKSNNSDITENKP